MAEYKVSVEKDYLVFAAAHFITYNERCESLHGHNYRVRAEVEGSLDENAFVLDFTVLKRIMRGLVDELDHKMLLPLENPALELREDEDSIHVSYEDRAYAFPRRDVILLAVPNTTAEMLARHLAWRLKQELDSLDAGNLTGLAVEVEESFGQSAWYRERLAHPRP